MSDIFIKNAGQGSAGWRKVTNIFIKNAGPGSAGWRPALGVWIRNATQWLRVWPQSGIFATRRPWIAFFSSDTYSERMPNATYPVVRIGTSYFGNNAQWDLNGWTASRYDYAWKLYDSIGTDQGTTLRSGTGSGWTSGGTGQDTLPTSVWTASNSTAFDRGYLGFEVIAVNSSSTQYNGLSVSTPTIMVVRQQPSYTGSPTLSTNNPQLGIAITYTSPTWNTTEARKAESARTTVQWFKNSTSTTTGGTLIGVGNSYTPTTNNTTYGTGSDVGFFIYAVETRYNSGTDYDLGSTVGVEAKVVTTSSVPQSTYVFTFGNQLHVSTNGYIGLGAGSAQGTDTIPSSGRYLAVIARDLEQSTTTSVWYWSDTSKYTIRWEGYDFGNTGNTKVYQATFYNNQSYADVLAITVTGTVGSTTAYQDDGTIRSTYSAGLTTGQGRRVYFDGTATATVSVSEQSKSSMVQVSGLTSGSRDVGYTTLVTATNQNNFTPGTISVSGGSTAAGTKYVTRGATLTVNNSSWPSGTTFTYQWYRSREIEGITPIALGTASTQSSTSVGEYLYCSVFYANSGQGIPTTFFANTESYYIVPTAPSYTLTNNSNGTFTISSVSSTGGTGYYGTWGSGNAIASSSSPTANATNTTVNSGAGSISVTLFSSVLVNYSGYSTRWSSWESTTNSVTVTAGSAPTNTSAPTLTGTAAVGQTLTFGVGTWSGSPTSYDLELYRGTQFVARFETLLKDAGNVTSSTYTVTQADFDSTQDYIRVFAQATNGSGTSDWVGGTELGPIAAGGSAPGIPTDVGLTGSGAVSWTASSGSPTSYEIEFFTAQNASGLNAAPNGGTGTGYTVTGITGVTYQLGSAGSTQYASPNNWARVRVRARNGNGASEYSAWVPSATTYT